MAIDTHVAIDFGYDSAVWTNARIDAMLRNFDPAYPANPTAPQRKSKLLQMMKKTVLEYDRAARQAVVAPLAEDTTGMDVT